MKWLINLSLSVYLLAGMTVVAAEEESAGTQSYDKYKVIYEQNIFSKDRLPPRSLEDRSNRRVRTTKVLSIYTLRGIAAEQGRAQRYAFIEEEVSGQCQMAKLGAEVLGGTIRQIQLNYVLFEQDGEIKKVYIGEQFGSTSTTVTTEVGPDDEPEAAASEKAAPEKTAEQPASGDESDILKKLMERRKRELGN